MVLISVAIEELVVVKVLDTCDMLAARDELFCDTVLFKVVTLPASDDDVLVSESSSVAILLDKEELFVLTDVEIESNLPAADEL